MVHTSYRKAVVLPGGFADPNKSSHQEALRETMEEVGIDCSHYPAILAWENTLEYESRQDHVTIWEITVTEKPPLTLNLSEIIWAKWLTLEEALNSPLAPHYRQYLEQKQRSLTAQQ